MIAKNKQRYKMMLLATTLLVIGMMVLTKADVAKASVPSVFDKFYCGTSTKIWVHDAVIDPWGWTDIKYVYAGRIGTHMSYNVYAGPSGSGTWFFEGTDTNNCV